MPRYCQSKKKLHSIVGGPYHIMNYWFQSLYKILQYNRAVIVISDTNAVRVTLVECSEAISTHFHIPHFLFPNSPLQVLQVPVGQTCSTSSIIIQDHHAFMG